MTTIICTTRFMPNWLSRVSFAFGLTNNMGITYNSLPPSIQKYTNQSTCQIIDAFGLCVVGQLTQNVIEHMIDSEIRRHKIFGLITIGVTVYTIYSLYDHYFEHKYEPINKSYIYTV